MKYKLLGKTGLKVSELCLGTMSFGDTWGYGCDEEVSKQCFDAFVEAGGNFFDCACNYSEGNSEKVLGKLMGENRERYVVASKCTLCSPVGPQYPNDPNAAGNGRKHLREELEHTLARLGTSYLDVLYVHGWDFTTPVKELMATLNDFVRSGKVNYLGVSNTPAYIVAQANTIADQYGWAKFSVYEGKYNLLSRSIENEVLPMTKDFGMAVTTWQPLAGAMLCGSEEELNIRIKCGYPAPSEAQMKVIHTANEIAEKRGVPVPQVALNWLRQRESNIIPIIGVRLPEHVTSNVQALEWKLSDEEMQQLNEVTAYALPYPQLDLNANINNFVYNFMRDKIDAPEVFPTWLE